MTLASFTKKMSSACAATTGKFSPVRTPDYGHAPSVGQPN